MKFAPSSRSVATASGAMGEVSKLIDSRPRPLIVATRHEHAVSHVASHKAGDAGRERSSPAAMEARREPQLGDTRLYRLRTRQAVPMRTNIRVVTMT